MIPCRKCGWVCFGEDLRYGLCPGCVKAANREDKNATD